VGGMDSAAAMAAMGLPTGFDTTHVDSTQTVAMPREEEEEEEEAEEGVNVGPVLHTANAEDFHDGVGAKLVQFAFDAFPQMKWSKNKFRGEAHLGRVRVNGKMAGANQRLKEGDVVTVHKEKIAKGPTKGVNSKVRARLAAQAAGSGGGGPGPDEEFSKSLDADGRCTKRKNGIICGCPDCTSLTEAEKKKIRNRKKKLAQERKKARLAEEAAAVPSAEGGSATAATISVAAPPASASTASSTDQAASADLSDTTASGAASVDPAQSYPKGWRFGGRSAPTPDAPAGVPYYHSPSGATSWDPPVFLPEGWTQNVEPSSSRSWYEYAATGTKSWTPPEGSRMCTAPPTDANSSSGATAAAAALAAAAAAAAAAEVATASSAEQMIAAAAAAAAAQATTRPGHGSALGDLGKRKAPETSTSGSSAIAEAESEESELEDEEDDGARVGVAKTTARIRKKPALKGQGAGFLQMKTKIVNGAGGKLLSQDSGSDSD
jgi:hypothetical protein